MGARTLQTRLTLRLLALVGFILACVAVSAVVVTDRVLDASATASARASALDARDALARELREGNSLDDAAREIVGSANPGRLRLSIRTSSGNVTGGGAELPRLPPGSCATSADAVARPWRVCAEPGPPAAITAAVPVDWERQTLAELEKAMVAVVLLALLALGVAVRSAVRGPVTELTALVRWTEHIAAEQPTAPGPPVASTREIAQLEAAFGALVTRLLDTLARERASSAHIAHELRTPLTSIVGELDALGLVSEPARAAAARIRGDVARLADVVEAILVLSDRSQGPGPQPVVNLADVARALAPSSARVEAPDEALVEADERLLTVAVRNLIDNADRHGSGVVLLGVHREGTNVRLSVVDRGRGLDAAARSRMFERYWRESADGQGRGLGLALVRAVAERHRGRAEAEPTRPEHGLTVSILLPLVAWHDASPPREVTA